MYIYDSVKKTKLPFEPILPNKASIYVCGPTVYDDAHLGHARSSLAFDLLSRTLKAHNYEVTMGKNFTDIDDKIIKKVEETGKSMEEITSYFIDRYLEEMAALGIQRADIEPKATESLEAIEAMIQKLIDKDIAYVISTGDVYFDTSKDTHYGDISHRVAEDEVSQSRVEHTSEKRNPKDFALWKACKGEDDICFNTAFSRGRPGWHIECSAMIEKHFTGDENYSIDIHGGGADLLFPHHENEAAQSRCATGHELSKYWMHNGFVQIDGEKMSKSLGNSFFLKDALKLYDGEVLRYYLNSVHYRNDFNFSEEELQLNKKRLDKLYRLKKHCTNKKSYANLNNKYKQHIKYGLQDDLNISKVLSYIEEEIQNFNIALEKLKEKKMSHLFVYQKTLERVLGNNKSSNKNYNNEIKKLIISYCKNLNQPPLNNNDFILNIKKYNFSNIHELNSKLSNKKFMKSYEKNLKYEIQTFITTIDIILGFGGKEPFTYFQIGVDTAMKEKIEALIEKRLEAKKHKDFKASDAIRDEISALGINIMDTADGTLWEKA